MECDAAAIAHDGALTPDEVLTIKDVAALLKLAEKTVYAMASAGVNPASMTRGQWRIKRTEPADAFVVGEPVTATAITYSRHPRASLTLCGVREDRRFSVGFQGARFNLAAVEAGKTWEAKEGDE